MDQLRSPPRPTSSRSAHARPRRRSSSSSSPDNHDPNTSHTSKRRRVTRSTASATASSPISPQSLPLDDPTPEPEVEESIDLTAGDESSALAKALAKQREDAVMAQRAAEHESRERGTALRAYKCPVCMDTPVDATSTVCGHLFCHQCIMDTLKFGEERRTDASGKSRGTCPVCRKPLTRADTPGTKRNLVPLQIKMKTRKRMDVAADL
ncbi:uncharacterized protein BDW47DRAFT_31609 [Aspergillus candidus]|uniref:RING-type domain-containing protein n=1 Tax=Aspergillus candidus TaxID=41067 RepID=A0A2I2FBU2_ASPCN|nr:hypothetical protein BDW47DRAFT_31609 [Aspergillus candidus]PLB38096.1 hypothetical protein BDW47DRAFT_31609 [Aspergillus candidus]